MTLKYIYNRFHQMKHDYIGETSFVRTCWLWLGWINNAILYGASISDYFAYGFYKLQHSGKQEYITYRRYHRIMRKANNLNDIKYCRDKALFNRTFNDLLGREWLDISTIDFQTFSIFLRKHETAFVKDISGYRAIGTQKIQCDQIDIDKLWKELKNNSDAKYIVEETIGQYRELEKLHPWSVNTIRVNTLYDTTNNVVHFMKAGLRIGNKKNAVDNLHYMGMIANIDIETGVVDSCAYDTHNNSYIFHPITGKQIVGICIPNWSACKKYIEEAARRLPTVRYIGWDLVIRENEQCCLIEANDNADHDLQQFHYKGLWKEYKAILKNL